MDKDLAAVQEARDLLERAHSAQQKLAGLSQEKTDAIVAAMVTAGEQEAAHLAEVAVEETGFGRVESKTQKNLFASRTLGAFLKNVKTVGIINQDPAKGIKEVAVPMGVVVGIIPSTNPTSTAMNKIIIALKARCAIVLSPHPRAKNCIYQTAEHLKKAALYAGCPEGAISCLSQPTLGATQELMTHKKTKVILATGGMGLVKAAYASGKPAFGVGPGNVPVYVDQTADVMHAARCVVESKTFDYGTICSSEQALVVHKEISTSFKKALVDQGAHFLSEKEQALMEPLMIKNRVMNPEIVGKSAATLAQMAGFSVSPGTTILVGLPKGVGHDHPFSYETLCPLIAWYDVDNWQEGCTRCKELLKFGGTGHSQAVHAQDEQVVNAFALEKPASRILVNAPTSMGGPGIATFLEPSMTLGCGAMGGNISSDNIGARHLLDIKRVAYIRPGYFDQTPHAPETSNLPRQDYKKDDFTIDIG